MRLSDEQMQVWIREGLFVVQSLSDGRQSMQKSDFERLAHSSEVKEASLRALANQIQWYREDEGSGRDTFCSEEIARRGNQYRQYIQSLKEIHAHYHGRFDLLREESPRVAAYILYSKVIRLSNMACLCLEPHFWETLMFLRPN